MAGRGKHDKFNIDLDLTAMLDVIFIILMVVMTNQLLTNAKDSKTMEEITAELDTAEAELELYKMRAADIENPDNGVVRVYLYASFDSNDPKTRHIRLMQQESALIEDLKLTPDNSEKVYGEFTDRLEAILTANDGVPVLLTLDDKNILYRDHVKLSEILDTLRSDHINLFARSGEGEE